MSSGSTRDETKSPQQALPSVRNSYQPNGDLCHCYRFVSYIGWFCGSVEAQYVLGLLSTILVTSVLCALCECWFQTVPTSHASGHRHPDREGSRSDCLTTVFCQAAVSPPEHSISIVPVTTALVGVLPPAAVSVQSTAFVNRPDSVGCRAAPAQALLCTFLV